MKVEQTKQIASNAIEQLRQALETGHSERLKEYLAAMARFRRYSWGNVMLIASQKPNATHVAGFHAWHKLGRFVKKGEKGILILAPIIRKKAENSDVTEPDESSSAVGFRAAYVFDVTQTDGQPLPQIGSVNGDPREYRDRLAKFVADRGIAFEYSEEIAPARGTSSGGKITLLPGQSPAEGLIRFWLGHANKTITDGYSLLKEDSQFRRKIAEQVNIGFEISASEPDVAPKTAICTQTTSLSTLP